MSHAELPVAVTGSDNTVVVEATGHRWISLCRKGIEILRESSGGSRAVFAATTGDYTVRTDGTLSSVSTDQHDIAPFEPTRRAGIRRRVDLFGGRVSYGAEPDGQRWRIQVSLPTESP